MKLFSVAGRIFLVLLGILLFVSSAYAYTGSLSIIPPLVGGPEHNTVTNVDVDTRTDNPIIIEANLYFVKKIEIETTVGVNSHLLITENPSRSDPLDPSFSFSPPQALECSDPSNPECDGKLVQATIYFWGPDIETLEIWHSHGSDPPYAIPVERVQPPEYGTEGRVLWRFTVNSFSDFYTNPLSLIKKRDIPWLTIVLLIISSASACVLFKR